MRKNEQFFYFIIFTAVFLLMGCGEKIEPGNAEQIKKMNQISKTRIIL